MEETVTLTVKKPIEARLQDALVKSKDETQDNFVLRSFYSTTAMKVYNNQINVGTAILLGRVGANKVLYGVKYPDNIDGIISYIDQVIQQSIQQSQQT